MYYVINGDIIGSRNISDAERNDLQIKLKNTLNDINNEYKADIGSDFHIYLGDAFEGLLTNPKDIYNIVLRVKNALYPYEMRYGIGIGHLSTGEYLQDIDEMDGPVFHTAREAVDTLKIRRQKQPANTPDIMIRMDEGENSVYVEALNGLLASLWIIETQWSKQARDTVIQMYYSKNQKACAMELGQSQPAISYKLKYAHFNLYTQLQATVNNIFANL